MRLYKLQAFIFQINNVLFVPITLALFIEILSSLQVIHLIFFSMAQFSTSSHFLTLSLSKNLAFLTGAFSLQDSFSIYNSLLKPVWILCLMYFLLHLLLFSAIARVILQNGQTNLTIMKILSWLYLLHSRIIFFPMQFFLLNLCNLYKSPPNGEFYQSTGWLVGSVILMILNSALAICRESLMYQINPSENGFAKKTNLYHQAMLIYKISVLLLYFWGITRKSGALEGSTVLHCIFGILLVAILYLKLPFFKFEMLKLAVGLASTMLCLSFISMIFVFTKDAEVKGSMEILIVLLPPLGIKVVISQFQSLFKRILQGQFQQVEHGIHFGLLIEDFLIKEKLSSWSSGAFFPNRENYFGALVSKDIDLDKLSNKKTICECEAQIYLHIIDKITVLVGKAPHVKALPLYKIDLFLKKGDDVPKVLEILRRLEGSHATLPVKSSIEHFNSVVERVYSAGDLSSESLRDLSLYFKYHDITNAVRVLMLKETNRQIEFWEDIAGRKLDAKKIHIKAEEIDVLFRKIRKECESNLNEFRKYFSSSMLLYSAYLNNVRQMRFDGAHILGSFQSAMLAHNHEYDAASGLGNSAVLIVSLDRIKAGVILNAAGSIENVFDLKKTELIGKKLGCLFPNAIAKIYQQNIQHYAKSAIHKLDHKEKTFGKTADDQIFELECHFQLYPYIGKELTVMIMLKKLAEPAPILIANNEGIVTDRSKDLELMLQAEDFGNMKGVQILQHLSPEMEKVNLAFNMIYGEDQYQVYNHRERSTSITKQKRYGNDFPEDSARNSSRPLLTSLGSPRKDTLEMPLCRVDLRISLTKAKLLCEEFREGKENILLNSTTKGKLSASIQIKPYVVKGEVYKVVRISDLKRETPCYVHESSGNASSESGMTLGDEFPVGIQNEMAKKTLTLLAPLKGTKTKGTMVTSSAGAGEKTLNISISESRSSNKDEIYQAQQKLNKIWDQDDQRSSIMSSNQYESRTVRVLRDIGSRKKLQRSLGVLQILLFVVIVIVLILSFVKFRLSKNSIEEIEKGISIINLATLRLQSVINSLLWSLLLLTGANYPQLNDYLTVSTDKFAEYNAQLKNELGLVRDQDFLTRAFQKDVTFWQIAVQGDTNENTFDTSTATGILLGKYLAIKNTQSLYQVQMMPDLLQIFNNTSNDYITSSIDLIYATDTILHELISRDIGWLNVVLSIEIVALVAFTCIFFVMIYIVSKSYQRLCRAMIRTQEGTILQRISQLKRVKGLLEDDIERKGFIQDSYDLLLQENSSVDANEARKTRTYQSNLSMPSMNKHLVQISMHSLLFIMAFTALFIVASVTSIHKFNTLGSFNDELSMLSYGCFQSSFLLSTMIYNFVFGSYPNMLVKSQAPRLQIAENFVNFGNLNQRLIETFLSSSKERDIDPFLVEILQTNVCKNLNGQSQMTCAYMTINQKMGLINMNTDYYNTLLNVMSSIGPNTTFLEATTAFAGILDKVMGEMYVMQDIYPIMISHILEGFEEMVVNAKNKEVTFVIVIYLAILGYTVFLYLKPLKDFQRVDIGRRKILKIIPVNIFQENKALKFYLLQDFTSEIGEIKSVL